MRYKVPQDVQREDQILLFLTLRQLIMLMIGGGITYMLYVGIKKNYNTTTLENILIFIPAALSVAFAFVHIKGIPLFQFILLIIEQVFYRKGRRYWNAGGGEPFTTMTFSILKKKQEQDDVADVRHQPASIENLANIMDRKNLN